MKNLTVHLSEPIAQSAYDRLAKEFKITDSLDHPEELDGIITRKIAVPGDLIRKASRLKVIANHGTGADQIDLKTAEECGVQVLSAPGQNARSVAELTVGSFLSLSYKMKYADQGLQKGCFERFGTPDLQGNEIYGKKLGLIGSGNIAKEVARIMGTAFGVQIYCWNPHKSDDELAKLDFIKTDTISDLLKVTDMASVHIPLTTDTMNLIGDKELSSANKDLLLVNTSRGGIINESALYNALLQGQIKGAACDVFLQEPPSRDNPLLSLPNFIGTPHVGGSTKEALERVGNLTVDNIFRVLKG